MLTIPLRLGDEGLLFALTAKFDLLAVAPGERATILDWKTSRNRTDPDLLRRRMQSQIYPYLVVEASAHLPWGPLTPDQVEMRYWFTAAPDDPVTLRYSVAQHAANHQLLQRLLAQIVAGETEADFPKVPDTEANRARFCAYCAYRSRCDRGVLAGDLDQVSDAEYVVHDPDPQFEISLDEVPEIAF